MNSFCTNCGKENDKKICPNCGVKMNTTHLFCSWCGTPLDENATLCTNCKEKVRSFKFAKLFNVLKFVTIIALFISIISTLKDDPIEYVSLFLLGIILLLPISILKKPFKNISNKKLRVFLLIILTVPGIAALVFSSLKLHTAEGFISALSFTGLILLILPITKNAILTITHKKLLLRKLLNIFRTILIVTLFIISVMNYPNVEFEVYTKDATKAAEIVFHEEIALKNESSFVINDSDVRYSTEPYENNENIRYVVVTLDYSAENSFGGMVRDSYIVELLFDVENGNYYRMDGTYIK